jgi:hypothetical protein
MFLSLHRGVASFEFKYQERNIPIKHYGFIVFISK